ncbi:MAG: DUF3576 domain-containing protein [Candidatus Fonsibacter lacus]
MNILINPLKKILYIFTINFLLILLNNCAKTDPVTGEKVVIETNERVRAREAADKQGGFFGIIGQSKSGTNFEFASSNVLWRATLKNLDFLPLISADYSGGILIYDWYAQSENPKEQIKISVQFLNNELRSDSLKVLAHKRICENSDKCLNLTIDQKFADSIKENIINNARILKIEETKKDKK